MLDSIAPGTLRKRCSEFGAELAGCARAAYIETGICASAQYVGDEGEEGAYALCALAGNGAAKTGERTLPVAPGDCLILLEKDTIITSVQPLQYAVTKFEGAVARVLLGEAAARTGNVFSPVDGALFAAMLDTRESLGTGGQYRDAALSFALLMEVMQACSHIDCERPGLAHDAAEYMRANYAFLSGMDELAEHMGVSKPHLIRVFSAHMGISPNKYLTQVRVEAACALLVDYDYSLEAVANLCGFAEANYFCKVFKRAMGVTPGAYRKSAAPERPSFAAREWEVF